MKDKRIRILVPGTLIFLMVFYILLFIFYR
ncbi:hypothetical protein NIASO_02120 [Niabella soli DSM 19437]|uniref:Uncharacterized protein n=1 Tax=Niabella soli DSM 19437 TaxID=929713 RepID=W0F240_9BACT|nr:hypothetical protein NIASO_02120 [Niabella soli DSM 19437]